eukprot:2930445-Rhodomonas_salina.3
MSPCLDADFGRFDVESVVFRGRHVSMLRSSVLTEACVSVSGQEIGAGAMINTIETKRAMQRALVSLQTTHADA